MWGRKRKAIAAAKPDEQPSALKDALHQARIEAAERTRVVVDLRDAEVARLELLNEALDPLFTEVQPEVDLFDRGVSRGETPRLWIDAVAHVAMGRDKRSYRFLHDSRMGRHVLAESHEIPDIVAAVTTMSRAALSNGSGRSMTIPVSFRASPPTRRSATAIAGAGERSARSRSAFLPAW